MPAVDFNEELKIPIRNHVLADLEVNSLIGDKFYGRQIATLDIEGDDAFPMAVFWFEGGTDTTLGIVRRFTMVIRGYSNSTYDEAYSVYKAIFERLGGGNGPITIRTDSGNIVIRPTSTPTETYENKPRIYGVGSRFSVIWIS